MTVLADGRPLLAVQDRERLFREALCACLAHYLSNVEVVDVAGPAPLLDLARREPLTYAVLEVGAVPWDVAELVSAVRSRRPVVQLIGLGSSTRVPARLGVTVVARTVSPARLADLVAPGSDRPLPFMLTASAGGGKRILTEQQLKVLSLLSLGLTASQVARRLGLSERGVAKSKQAAFAKLGTQSQAEALSAALAAGLLGPSRKEAAP